MTLNQWCSNPDHAGCVVTGGGKLIHAPADTAPDVHKPFTDDGVTYCGWDGHEGCGEMWPCSTTRRARALFLGAALEDAAAEDAG